MPRRSSSNSQCCPKPKFAAKPFAHRPLRVFSSTRQQTRRNPPASTSLGLVVQAGRRNSQLRAVSLLGY
ncbi:hypothetical protein LshimejAT787_0410530 [Lyophyllum shimeji]|uniref:Uncharacterized protein n=1 Tax=Lyophyllum shimeji TaxID=47721 RepID=A0A9P3PKL2_LYOSH|nr:hypothetical protein LshimejAT787_0410530 [Lyophyllum shimeji]